MMPKKHSNGLSLRRRTYNCTPLMRLPNMPIIPRNSMRSKLRTTDSWHTLETPYRVAPTKHNTSPSKVLVPVIHKASVIPCGGGSVSVTHTRSDLCEAQYRVYCALCVACEPIMRSVQTQMLLMAHPEKCQHHITLSPI